MKEIGIVMEVSPGHTARQVAMVEQTRLFAEAVLPELRSV